MIITYIAIFLISWVVLGFAFTLLIWPVIARRLNEDYPRVNSNGTDNL